jgi:hypothetical protein
MTYRELKEMENGILISHHFSVDSPNEYDAKGSTALNAVSREHYFALSLAKDCQRAALSGDEKLLMRIYLKVLNAYERLLEPHFQFEETSLLPLLESVEIKPIVERSLADHCQLRALLGGLRQRDPESLGSFGKYLTDHVRFEERELVPLFEGLLY